MASDTSTAATSDTVTPPLGTNSQRASPSTAGPRSMPSSSTQQSLFGGFSIGTQSHSMTSSSSTQPRSFNSLPSGNPPQPAPSSSGTPHHSTISSGGQSGLFEYSGIGRKPPSAAISGPLSGSSSSGTQGAPSSTPQYASSSSTQPQFASGQAQLSTPINLMHAVELSRSLLSGKFSDLTIKHGTRVWNAHKVVIGSQSSVFEDMINLLNPVVSATDIPDVLTQQPPTLDLNDPIFGLNDHHEVVVSMMEYFYSTNYATVDKEPDFSLAHHAKVYRLASDFAISGLKELSAKRFQYSLLNNVKDLNIYFHSVKWVYDATDPQNPALRQILVHAAVTELPKLLHAPADRTRFLNLTSTVKDFQADIFMYLMQKQSEATESNTQVAYPVLCDECGPRDDDDGYLIEMECKGCGKDKPLEFY